MALLLPASVLADSLKNALASSYLFNPTLKAKRSELRSNDEEVPIAKSGFRPRITGTIENSFTDQTTRPDSPGTGTNYPKNYSIGITQPIFRGFRTVNAVRGAEAIVEASRENLRSVEQNVLLNAVTAYMDVFRDEATLQLQLNNQRVLTEQLRAAKDRFEVGEVTRTDVAQAQARQSGAVSQVSAARANLALSRSSYQRLIGSMPSGVSDPGAPLKMIPRSQEEAVRIGEGENPFILEALFRERSGEHLVRQIKGELLPELNVEASYTKGIDPSKNTEESDNTIVTGRLTVPIYQAGEVSARIRQAKETQSQFRQLIDEAREQVRADVISNWGQYISSRAQIESARAQVEANRIALAGVREEEKVGQRTLLDVLDAEQELLNSEVALVSTKRDYVVAAYALLSSIGRLSASELGLSVQLYDATQNYRRVRNKAYGWSTSVEAMEDPQVAPVTAPGVTPGQRYGDGPAYTR
ncbi:MAG: TolC family outer membrane protein [Hyphomicrobiales bacterium]|nr:TolC family outer membrane protein [Hyphomicrobiales bacterium]